MTIESRRADHLRERMDRVRRELRDLEIYWLSTEPKKPVDGRYGKVTGVDVAEIRAAFAFRVLMAAELRRLFGIRALASRCRLSYSTVRKISDYWLHAEID